MNIETLALTLVFIAFLAFAAKRLLTYLHALQQDDYDNARMRGWMVANKVFDKRLNAAILIIWIISFFINTLYTDALIFIAFALAAVFEKDPRTLSKKKLNMTARARRIFAAAFALAFITGLLGFKWSDPFLWMVAIQILPFLLMLGNRLLQPIENAIQQKYWDEAHKKLLNLKPTIIGITGSFGKTSVKHILGHVLKMQARTLITPGSVNTPMGITRIIREKLDESIKYFVVEMGAYAPGSIQKLCRLAPPDMAIVTAIGHAHYERFKTLDVVAETKFALPLAALAKNGKVLVADQVLNFPYTKKVYKDHTKDFIVCGGDENNALSIHGVNQTAEGLSVHITWRGADYVLNLPLFGVHHGHNAALAFAAAATLGMAPEHIIAALKTTPQIEHRLEVKPQPDGTTIIDDAFNSNPGGFKSALEVLSILAMENKGRAILITPGMVEMGAAHDDEHYKIGTIAGGICDVALIVMPERIGAFIKGFKESGPAKTIIEVRSFAEAAKWLDANRKRGDVVLIENDLPDIYESIPKI